MQGFFAGGRWGAAGHGRFHWQQRQVCPKGSKLADLGIPGSVLICRSEGFLDRLWRFPLTVPHKLAGGRRMSSKSALLGLIALGIGGCTPGDPNVYRSSNQQRTIGHGISVTVTNVASELEAQPFAEEYCSARGKAAKFNRMEKLSYRNVASTSALFDCI
jgi:hypothetical protein